MTIQRTRTLTALVLALAAAPAWAQEGDNMAEDRDIGFIEQCLQRAVEQQVPEDRIDAFIDRCINEFYERGEQRPDAETVLPDDAGNAGDGEPGGAGAAPGD